MICVAFMVVLIIRARKISQTVEQLANSDPLTQLPNRRSFFQRLDEAIEASLSKGERLAVGIIDLDGFKPINDIFGHAVGDQLLTDASARLRQLLDDDVELARLGGDEFGILFHNPSSDEVVLELGEAICEALKIPFIMSEGVARVAGTIGFAIYPDAADGRATLFERADYALYHSKQHSKGRPVLFSEDHEMTIRHVATLEQKLLEADLEQELYVEYQPIIDTDLGCVAGMEALARWKSPDLGVVSPAEFILAAEQTGIISKLTAVLLQKSLEEAKRWPSDVYLSFNLSAVDLASPEAVARLIDIMEDSGFPTNRIIFEITETAVMQDFGRAQKALDRLSSMGARIALDDFGTGYSSLGYIQKMPLDRLKVDRAFIDDLEHRKTTRDIMRSIYGLCENLSLECVVEGVENERQLELLNDIGCRYIQGYYFSEPLSSDLALKFLEEDTSRRLNEWVCVA